ncbi:unnamed protein product, partial [Choristocarpus tenellus]
LIAVLRRLGAPVLELAYFPPGERASIVIREPNEASRGALNALSALRETLAPPYSIAESGRSGEGGEEVGREGKDEVGTDVGDGHALDSRGRRLRLRWNALGPDDLDALVQRGRQFSLEESGEVEGLPLPPGATDRL